MEFGTPHSLVSDVGTIYFNVPQAGGNVTLTGDTEDKDFCVYLLQGSPEGLYSPEIRNPTNDRTVRDGGIVHPFFKGAKFIEVNGLLIADQPANRTAMRDHLLGVTDPLLRTDGTYSWLVTTGDYASGYVGETRSHTVRLFETVEIKDPQGGVAGPKTFNFQLIAYGVQGEDGFEDMEV